MKFRVRSQLRLKIDVKIMNVPYASCAYILLFYFTGVLFSDIESHMLTTSYSSTKFMTEDVEGLLLQTHTINV